MTGYTVRGQWPEYVVSSDNGGEIHHAPGMAAVIRVSTERQRLQDSFARLHRKHRRTWRGHCTCGWRRDIMSFTDHSDHVARVMVDCIWGHPMSRPIGLKWLSWVLEPGDSITWEATAIPGTPK